MKIFLLALACTFISITSCSSIPLTLKKTRFDLDSVRSLYGKNLKKTEIRDLYGNAQLEILVRSDQSETWIYEDDREVQRLSFFFSQKSQTLSGVQWTPDFKKSKFELSQVSKTFPNNNFKRHKITFQYVPCAIDSETTLVDNSAGILIGLNKDEISYITWQEPGSIIEQSGWIGYIKRDATTDFQIIADRRVPYSRYPNQAN